LARSFYEPSAELVAPALLGHLLVRNTPEGPCGGPIVEVEAYLVGDPACHSYRGESPRNRVMFGPPGHAYVYLIYGLYYCVNAVCRPKGCGEAVLIRAIEATMGEAPMRHRRRVKELPALTSGPAKLCAALEIDRRLDGVDLCQERSPLFVARNPDHKQFLLAKGPMVSTTRVGITKAAELSLRFYLGASPFVSKRISAKPPKRSRHAR
jgi:DNA-3-methyladenine glycosylase